MNARILFVVAGWFGFAVTSALLVCVLAYVLGDRRPAADPDPVPVPEPRIPAQRAPSAAVIVHAYDAEAFDAFLRELILTPHVEEVLA